jgi:hypothetical protein
MLRGHWGSLRFTGACRSSCAAWAQPVATFRARSDSSRLLGAGGPRSTSNASPGLIASLPGEHALAARLAAAPGFAQKPGQRIVEAKLRT